MIILLSPVACLPRVYYNDRNSIQARERRPAARLLPALRISMIMVIWWGYDPSK